jgi:alpha-L-arabinofuranosidase
MLKTNIFIDTNFQIGNVDEGFFGSFIEYMGKCIYGGIFIQRVHLLMKKARY